MTSIFYVLRQLCNMAQMYPQKVAVVLDDQTWTYSELIEQIERVTCCLQRLNIVQGQIIYQFVERGFEMICGFFGIMYVGGVYCPLNPKEPSERLAVLFQHIQGQYVLLHEKTRNQFPSTAVQHMVLLDHILHPLFGIQDMDDLPVYSEWGPAFIIFTSGTTGRPKAIVHTHKSLLASVIAYVQWDLGIYTIRDQALQVASCSWILHVYEILLPPVVGGTLVLLKPGGNLDMSYFSRTLFHQQVTTFIIGPALIRALINYLKMSRRLETFKFVRNVCMAGEAVKLHEWVQFTNFLSSSNACMSVLYGMSECSGVIGCSLLNIDDAAVPIGYPLPGVYHLLIDEQGQVINHTDNSSAIGQIHIGGSVLFNCYLNDPENTATMFVTINKQVYMKTGDLARYNTRGELVYFGRIDYQIKVHGQRVEPAEIENTIINCSPSKISNCLVTKAPQTDNLLVAYVISNDLELDTKEIRDYCNKHLRPYMVPCYIIVLDKFPVNANGKIDRNQLPLSSLRCDASTNCVQIEDQQMSKLEKKVYSLWCSTLQLDVIPRHMNYFALGGSSLSLIELYKHYQLYLAPDKQFNVLDFFTDPTIAKHVQLLINGETKTDIIWTPLHLVQGRASYAQESIWLAEQIRFIQQTPSFSPYNTSLICRIDSGHLSIKECLRAIDLIVARHMVFHTRFTFNVECGYLQQSIIEVTPNGQRSYPVYLSTVQSEQEFKALGFQETLMSLDDGVFRCHFVRYGHTNQDALKQGDFIIFTFHHGSFDAISIDLFLNELILAYSGSYNLQEPLLQYIDYAAYERSNADMNAAKDYWREVLRGYSWNRQLDLPYDFRLPTNARRSGRCWFIVTLVPSEIIDATIARAKELNTTLFQLTLTCFYIFLAQLSPCNQDACVTIPIMNRDRPELENIIGLFVNMLPCRVVFDASSASTVTFNDLLHKVQNNLINTIKYGNMPYLELLELHRVPSHDLQLPFLHAYFALIGSMDHNHLDRQKLNLITLSSNQDSCSLSPYYQSNSLGDENIFVTPNMFDTDVTIYVDTAKKEMLICWTYSTDLFAYTTIDDLSKRFVRLLGDLFVATPLQQLGTTPLVKLIPMANEPINLWINNQQYHAIQEQLESTRKVSTPLEEHIQAVFSYVLGAEQIDVNRSFFEQGGTSLKALQAIYLLRKSSMTATVDANLFFSALSVTELARTIEASR